ncbi:MAG: cyclase family protein [Myxococcales bacterium]|nr:cyclase family protein [Myxococcales bacterium]
MTTTKVDIHEWAKVVSNWGRWGADDEKGTTNYITPAKLVEAAGCVRRGVTFSLGIPFDSEGPQLGQGGRTNPVHLMRMDGGDNAAGWTRPGMGTLRVTDDYIMMPLQAATQWDSLAHVFYEDHLYNGFSSNTVTSFGAEKNSIDKQYKGIASRGVLLDIARLKGVRWLEHGYGITRADLEKAERTQGVEIREGDVVLVRTGWRTKFVEDGSREEFMAGEPGLTVDTLEWIHERRLAAIASDNWALEVLPGEDPEVRLPFHQVAIRDMGLTLGEMFDLDELAEDCAQDGVWECLFVAPPLRVTRAVGSPINPLAIK